jgi:hypothetical protein
MKVLDLNIHIDSRQVFVAYGTKGAEKVRLFASSCVTGNNNSRAVERIFVKFVTAWVLIKICWHIPVSVKI